MKKIKKVGIVTMPKISVGGGFARVVRDLIASLNDMGKEVILLSPFKIDLEKISFLYGPVIINKIYYPNRLKSFFSHEETLGRKLLKRDFKKMAKEVDFIIDLDGGILHNYLPKNFDKSRYVIWRVSGLNRAAVKAQNLKNWKITIKNLLEDSLFRKRDFPKKIKMYAVDEWTKRDILKQWHVKPQKNCLYPEIKIKELNPYTKKENLIVILGRIARNKSIHDSIKIFSLGTKNFPEYNLVIAGGATPDSEEYIKFLKKIIKNFGIENRVKIIKDPSFEDIKIILQKSKVIIDAQKEVSLTMTSIEAMAAGNIVLGYKNSGGYTDILDNGKYGYGFLEVEEGGKKLHEILTNLKNKNINNKSSIRRAKEFGEDKFIKTLKNILEDEF